MKNYGSLLAILIVIGIIVAVGWGGYIGIRYVIGQFGLINPQLAALLTISALTAIICSLLIAGAIRTLNGVHHASIHQEKAVIYTRFIEAWISGIKNGTDLFREMYELKPHLLILSGDAVLKQFDILTRMLQEEGQTRDRLVEQAEKVLLEMRKDLGNRNRGILKGDLLEFLKQS